MPTMRIMHLHKMHLDLSDKSIIPDREYAFICMMALAVDELSTLKRLLLQGLRGPPKDVTLTELMMSQTHSLSRILSAKIVEADGMVSAYIGHLKTSNGGQSALEFLQPRLRPLTKLRRDPLYKLTVRIRNKLASHYDLDVALDLIKRTSRPKTFAVLHPLAGNTYYRFGEQSLFQLLIDDYFMGRRGRETTLEDLDEWHSHEIAWCRELAELFDSYIEWLLNERFPGWKLVSWKPYLEPQYVGDLTGSTLPIFLEGEAEHLID